MQGNKKRCVMYALHLWYLMRRKEPDDYGTKLFRGILMGSGGACDK